MVVAVIGERWVSAAEGGARRLDDTKDFVRIAALAGLAAVRGLRVLKD